MKILSLYTLMHRDCIYIYENINQKVIIFEVKRTVHYHRSLHISPYFELFSGDIHSISSSLILGVIDLG